METTIYQVFAKFKLLQVSHFLISKTPLKKTFKIKSERWKNRCRKRFDFATFCIAFWRGLGLHVGVKLAQNRLHQLRVACLEANWLCFWSYHWNFSVLGEFGMGFGRLLRELEQSLQRLWEGLGDMFGGFWGRCLDHFWCIFRIIWGDVFGKVSVRSLEVSKHKKPTNKTSISLYTLIKH